MPSLSQLKACFKHFALKLNFGIQYTSNIESNMEPIILFRICLAKDDQELAINDKNFCVRLPDIVVFI